MRWILSIAVLCLLAVAPPAWSAKKQACVTAEQATHMTNKDVCVTAHVYDVVQLPDGTRYLDVCRPDTPDERCRFTIISPWEDRDEVGALEKYRDTDVRIRGVVQPIRNRYALVLSHVRQFYGGPPKFRPNPRLLHGFNGEQATPPIRDPNLHSGQAHSGYGNPRMQEPLNKGQSTKQ